MVGSWKERQKEISKGNSTWQKWHESSDRILWLFTSRPYRLHERNQRRERFSIRRQLLSVCLCLFCQSFVPFSLILSLSFVASEFQLHQTLDPTDVQVIYRKLLTASQITTKDLCIMHLYIIIRRETETETGRGRERVHSTWWQSDKFRLLDGTLHDCVVFVTHCLFVSIFWFVVAVVTILKYPQSLIAVGFRTFARGISIFKWKILKTPESTNETALFRFENGHKNSETKPIICRQFWRCCCCCRRHLTRHWYIEITEYWNHISQVHFNVQNHDWFILTFDFVVTQVHVTRTTYYKKRMKKEILC